MKNKLTDLNDHMFAQLERLTDEDLKPDELEAEIKRSKALTCLAKHIEGNARLVLDGQQYVDKDLLQTQKKLPAMFGPNGLKALEGGKK